MQTFLPYSDFEKTASILDWRRLGKQRIETWQILNILLELRENPEAKIGWMHHPAVKMWRGFEGALWYYGVQICSEWRRRGYNDNMLKRFGQISVKMITDKILTTAKPAWLGNERFHCSHQSNLIRKMPEHYGKIFLDVPDNLAYYWPN
jgi:hypothetical protein